MTILENGRDEALSLDYYEVSLKIAARDRTKRA